MELKRAVITGLGALTPIGNNVQDYWTALVKGESGANTITYFDASAFKTQFACELKGFDIYDHIERKEVRRLDPFSQYALIAASEAIEDAKIDVAKMDANRAGVVWGSGIGGIQSFEEESHGYFRSGVPRFSPFFIPKMIVDIVSGHLSIKYGFRGPNYVTVSACASSNNAIIDAFNLIRLGKSDVILSGGSEASISEHGVGGFNALKALSTRNDSPRTASRPFDADRDGFVLGEGAGALVIEELEHARSRGVTIYAEIVGTGLSADAHHITAPHPEGLGAKMVMRYALEEANISPAEIDYINVHGTSTPLGDSAEIKAIQEVFGEHAYNLNISSTKSMTGHLLGAAGAVEAIACIKAMEHRVVPPTINHFTDDPAIDSRLNLTLNRAQQKTVRLALSNTFGFGGHNTSIVLKAYSE